MKVIKSELPSLSILNTSKDNYDYIDSYKGSFTDVNNTITSATVGKAFFSSAPKWIESLMHLRNRLVSIFGLKTSGNDSNREAQLANFKCEPGEQLGLFKVFDKNKNEIILGEDDKHLNFRISLFLDNNTGTDKKTLTISTAVKFNNWLGRLYFLPVKPFHKLIVPTMLTGTINNLLKQDRKN